MQIATFQTVWTGGDGAPFEPDMSNAPSAPAGFFLQSAVHPPENGATPKPGEPVTVTLTFASLPTADELAAVAVTSLTIPPPDGKGFFLALSNALDDATLESLLAVPVIQLMKAEIDEGDYTHLAGRWAAFVGNPPSSLTSDQLGALTTLAQAHHLPIAA